MYETGTVFVVGIQPKSMHAARTAAACLSGCHGLEEGVEGEGCIVNVEV
jgi:hypothetical protein